MKPVLSTGERIKKGGLQVEDSRGFAAHRVAQDRFKCLNDSVIYKED
jgi:hypothetical protein